MTWPDWADAEPVFAAHVAVRLDELDNGAAWWFLRKYPHWRLRVRTSDHRAVEALLDDLVTAGTITSWQHGIYEPETAAFGGEVAMAIVHDLFCADSRGVLTYARQHSPALGRRELSLLLIRAMLQHGGLDWFETGDADGWQYTMPAGPNPGPLPILTLETSSHTALLQAAEAGQGGLVGNAPIRRLDVPAANIHGRWRTAADGGVDLLLTAQYDGVGDHPGLRQPAASDNASGVAVVLEAARILTPALPAGAGLSVAVLDGEETGALGSAHHAQRLRDDGATPQVINVDGAGHLQQAAAIEAGGPAHGLLAALDQAGRHTGLPLVAGAVASDNRRYAAAGLAAVGIGAGDGRLPQPGRHPGPRRCRHPHRHRPPRRGHRMAGRHRIRYTTIGNRRLTMKMVDDGQPARPQHRGGVRLLVPRPRRPEPGTDRGIPRPAGPADARRGDRRGGRAGSVHRLATSEGPHGGAVRAGGAGRQRPVLPDQHPLHRLFPVRRRRRDGPTRTHRDRRLRMNAVTVRPMRATDAKQVLAIYQAGMDTGNASFEHTAPDWVAFDTGTLADHRFVAVDTGDTVLGWVAVSAVSSRPVYAGVVEHSVYVDPAAHRRGVGRALLEALIASTEAAGIWTIQSGIFPENTASLAFHHAAGFRTVGVRERVGRHESLGNRWRDVVFIERRSARIT
jgi:L-amino acid N-acyltransferase YncA